MRGARPELRIVDEGSEWEPSANLPKVGNPANLPLETVPAGNSFGRSSRQVGDMNCGISAVEKDANLRVDNPIGCLLDVPEGLPPAITAQWRIIVKDLQDRRLWKESMTGIVTSFVLAQATVQRLELEIATEGASVQGAGGARKPHPATGLLRSSRETVARLGAELGLTPTARSRKSLQPSGQATLFDNNPFDV